jgi:hypothetical protein
MNRQKLLIGGRPKSHIKPHEPAKIFVGCRTEKPSSIATAPRSGKFGPLGYRF